MPILSQKGLVMTKTPFGALTDLEWVETLNEWLNWMRSSQVNHETNIGQFSLSTRKVQGSVRVSEVSRMLQALGLFKQAPGWVKSKPIWWVSPDGEVTLKDYLSVRKPPRQPVAMSQRQQLQAREIRLERQLEAIQARGASIEAELTRVRAALKEQSRDEG